VAASIAAPVGQKVVGRAAQHPGNDHDAQNYQHVPVEGAARRCHQQGRLQFSHLVSPKKSAAILTRQ
jgi:hypothetical protein